MEGALERLELQSSRSIAPSSTAVPTEGGNGSEIPETPKRPVERLARAGVRYRALEREYRAVLTELARAVGGIQND